MFTLTNKLLGSIRTYHKVGPSENTGSESSAKISESQKGLDTLTLSQKKAVEEILAAIDKNPESQESMKRTLGDAFHTVTHSKLDGLLQRIEGAEAGKLANITAQYNKGKLSGSEATQNAQDTIHHYTGLSLLSLKDSMQTQSA